MGLDLSYQSSVRHCIKGFRQVQVDCIHWSTIIDKLGDIFKVGLYQEIDGARPPFPESMLGIIDEIVTVQMLCYLLEVRWGGGGACEKNPTEAKTAHLMQN